MTNREKINAIPNEEFAKLLVKEMEVELVDSDYDETLYSYFETQYGNEEIGWHEYYVDAIKAAIEWLEMEVEC